MRKPIASLTVGVLLSGIVLVHAKEASDPATTPGSESPDVVTGTQPNGTVDLTGGSIAAGIGFSWGHGKLNYRGESHSFKISGVSIVDVGAANISASGRVYNLGDLADFSGNYVPLTAGFTVPVGSSLS